MQHTGRHPRASRLGLLLTAVLAAYVLAVALLPLAHHDLLCHLKSTTHCTTCIVGASAEPAADPATLARLWLDAAGAVSIEAPSRFDSAQRSQSSGRAPPTAA